MFQLILDYEMTDFNTAIQTITQRSNEKEDSDSYAFKGILSISLCYFKIDLPPAKRRVRVFKRLRGINAISSAHEYIRFSVNINMVLREIKDHLEKWMKDQLFEDEDLQKEFKITQAGDIFKPISKSDTKTDIIGQGVLITRNNEVIEANFIHGIIQNGKMWMVYNNGEYYEGSVMYKGIKNGTGTYFYSNGDVYM